MTALLHVKYLAGLHLPCFILLHDAVMKLLLQVAARYTDGLFYDAIVLATHDGPSVRGKK